MNDDRPPPINTERPPDGEDMYEASTKVGEASPEMLALMKAAREGDLKAPSVPQEMRATDSDRTRRAEPITDAMLAAFKAERESARKLGTHSATANDEGATATAPATATATAPATATAKDEGATATAPATAKKEGTTATAPATAPAKPPPPEAVVVAGARAPIVGLSIYSVVVLALATAASGWLGYIAWQAWANPDASAESPWPAPRPHAH